MPNFKFKCTKVEQIEGSVVDPDKPAKPGEQPTYKTVPLWKAYFQPADPALITAAFELTAQGADLPAAFTSGQFYQLAIQPAAA